MKTFLFLCLVLISFQSQAQEMLSPLFSNADIISKNPINVSRTIDQDYIYAIDTIHLPFKDDFSKDLFKKYNATPNDANVSDTLFHTIFIGGVPDVDTAAYMNDTTIRVEITKNLADSLIYDTFNQPSITITHCDLDVYPVVCITKTVWPATTIIDSMFTATSPDGIYPITPADIIQDSAQVYFVEATDTISRWVDNFAYLNSSYPINPPTIGVATLDGLNDKGYPYDFSTAFTYGIADYLTSKPIFLGRDENNSPYGIADSVYLSFYYQPQGLGNSPETADSLVLQFWSPIDNQWYSMWRSGGLILDSNFAKDTGFRKVLVPVKNNKFFADGFQFRFLNYASLSGSFDHWNIDYVYLEEARFANDTIHDDVAFVEPVLSLLKDYTAIPWKHYAWDVNGFVVDSVLTKQKNISNSAKLMSNFNLDVIYNQSIIQTINNPNTPNSFPQVPFTTQFDIGNGGFYFDTLLNDTCATFELKFRHLTTPDVCRNNDTISFIQEFSDYYAYDDGTAEAAYGVQGVGGINPKIASKFELLNGDSIKGVNIHFSPSANDRSSTLIIMTIWEEGSGGKPGAILHEDISFSTPKYNLGTNGFFKYQFDSVVYIPSGTYFVGWQQTTIDVINVGYDLNINNDANTYYNSNGTWSQSGFGGTMMIRPTFVYDKDYIIGIDESLSNNDFSVYPNPTQDYFYLKGNTATPLTFQLMDVNGKILQQGIYQDGINIEGYENGLYMLRLTNQDSKSISFQKVIKN